MLSSSDVRRQGQIQTIQKELEIGGWDIASYIDAIYFTENSLKIITNLQKKGWLRSTRPAPKAAHKRKIRFTSDLLGQIRCKNCANHEEIGANGGKYRIYCRPCLHGIVNSGSNGCGIYHLWHCP